MEMDGKDMHSLLRGTSRIYANSTGPPRANSNGGLGKVLLRILRSETSL
jgi:hypothetical protein